MIVLSGDVGGTGTRLQIGEFTADGVVNIIKSSSYRNGDYAHFNDVITDFLFEMDLSIDSVCFGVAGPVINEEVELTNRLWVIKASDIVERLKVDPERVRLLNDFEAIGYGLETLTQKDLITLQAGKLDEKGTKAYLGAGTGLGVGFMTFYEGMAKVYPTEGGHIDFAPTDNLQDRLLKFLRTKFYRVSVERLLSGQGLINIYKLVCLEKGSNEKANVELDVLLSSSQNHVDIAAAITEYAIEQGDLLAKRALDIFINVYGTAAGNLALTTLPYGGLYVVGGIAPKLFPKIKTTGFLEAFNNKGRMAALVKNIPLHVVLNTEVGLNGATLYAKKFLI